MQDGRGISDRPDDSQTPESLESVADQDIGFLPSQTKIIG